ncbi:MAG: OB-fold domain-containing protein [Myxococcales bacterium]|nr:OB-fold domain-containing protein [Myxococcales bacterium]MDH3404911.1 OB-fold domain-containing protein [Acidobacteriota bacterium]
MSPAKAQTPAVEGWFRSDPDGPRLLGTRCSACGSYFFPKETFACRNPACGAADLEEVPLSRRGRLWSFTNNCYPPPAPYVTTDPFEPYAIAAVELEAEKMVVLGQVVPGVGIDRLEAGMQMELVVDTLYEDDEREYVVWKWRPVAD